MLPAVQPLLGETLPWTADGLLHFHRLAQLHRALRHGIPFPRWAPDMGFGFGFPLFNYYAPLSYYVAEVPLLLGLSTQRALLAAFVLATLAAGIGAYLCGRDLFGPPAGFVAALAFVYAPYNLYNVVHRGALAEAWGLAWLPFILWAMRRLATRGRRLDLALTTVLYAALILTHNIVALIATPLLIAYATVLWSLLGRGRQRAYRLGGALLLGLGLTAFFWGPALLEMEYVQIHQLYAPADLDYHNNFTGLGQLLSPPQPVDPALINPPIPRSLGWFQLALGLVALSSLRPLADGRVHGRSRRRPWAGPTADGRGQTVGGPVYLGLLGLGLLVLVGLMLPLSVGVWDRLPLLRFVQFPWRFLGPADLFLALLAGAGAAHLPGPDRIRLPVISALVIVFALTWLFPHFYPPQPEPTPLSLIAFEQETGALGTTSAGDYLPIWVRRLPPADSLVPAYEEAGAAPIIPRLVLSELPPGTQILEAHYDLTAADLWLDAPSAFTATFNWYFFPGWLGRLDGQPHDLRPVGEHGRIGTDVPAGRHHLTIRFGDTPLRRWATAASIASLAVLLTTTLFLRPYAHTSTPSHSHTPSLSLLPAALVALALFGLKTLYLDHHDSLFRRSRFDGQSVEGVQVPRRANFDDQLALMGYDLRCQPTVPGTDPETDEGCTVPADGLVRLALYWRAMRPLDTDYSIAAHLVDDRGRRYGQRDSQHPAGYPTSRWETDTYARDLHQLAIWPGTPPGPYTLTVGVYDVTTGHSLDVRNAAGAPVGTTLPLTSIRVTRSTQTGVVSRPIQSPDPDSLEIAHPLTADLGGGLRLLGVDPPPARVDAGDHLPLTLYWQAVSAPDGDYTARLSLVGPDSADMDPASADTDQTSVAQQRATPGRASHPTSAWLPGDLVRDGRSFLIPAATPTGEYTLQLDLLDTAGTPLAPATELLDVTVHAPERSFTLPAPQHPITASLENLAVLLGYDLSGTEIAPGQSFTCTLYWQAQATADVDPDRLRSAASAHVVFVHLLDESERIQAQSDRVPAGGSRPTTGWLPGEVIEDPHPLTVAPDAPAGRYVLEIGMYDPASGQRLRVLDERGADAGDNIRLPTPIQVTR